MKPSPSPVPPPVLPMVLVFWLLVVFLFFWTGASPVAGMRLFDTDDYMRFVQLFRWLDGGGWHDFVEPRLNPPAGLELHWSRLADLPLAAVVVAVEPWFGRETAAMAAAVAIPALLLLGFFLTAAWAARPLPGRRGVLFAALVPMFLMPALFQFAPGRVDHHAWQILIAFFAMGLLSRIAVGPPTVRRPVAAGLVFATALWIGAEILPWLALFTVVLAVLWVARGGTVLDAALIFAATLFAAAAAVLPLARPPALWTVVACDAYSSYYVALAGLVLLFWGAIRLLARRLLAGGGGETVPRRLAIVGGVGAGCAALLWTAFPECRGGPYGGVDPRLAAFWLSNVAEAQPIWTLIAGDPGRAGIWLFNPILAATVAGFRAVVSRGRTRRLWCIHLAFLGAALLLLGWEVRILTFAHLFAAVPLAWLITTAWLAVERRWPGWRGSLLKAAAVLAISPVPAIVLPALLIAPVPDDKPGQRCNVQAAAPLLADRTGLGATPRLIASFIDLGPELLYRTPHAVLSAPYHRNLGILDAHAFFRARDLDEARAVAGRRGIGLVLLCPRQPEMALYAGGEPQSLAHHLAAGDGPGWLRPIELPPGSGLRLFEVVGEGGGVP